MRTGPSTLIHDTATPGVACVRKRCKSRTMSQTAPKGPATTADAVTEPRNGAGAGCLSWVGVAPGLIFTVPSAYTWASLPTHRSTPAISHMKINRVISANDKKPNRIEYRAGEEAVASVDKGIVRRQRRWCAWKAAAHRCQH